MDIEVSAEIFNKIRNHLLTQNEKSSNGEVCLYRDLVVGCLIPDEYYNPDLEGEVITGEVMGEVFEKVGVPTDSNTLYMLLDLLQIHDTHSPDQWEEELNKLEKIYGL